MTGEVLRLAVSGTYSTGKSTTTEALSLAAGISRTHAMTARELIVGIAPGKVLEELSPMELTALGLRRLEERIHHEAAQPGSFVSDGSVIHEWIYGTARLRAGINPGAGIAARVVKNTLTLPYRSFYKQYMDAYGLVVKARAKRSYDAFIHLPVEFPLKADGHRPVSESFRRLSDQLILQTLDELGIPYHVVGGSIQQRLEKIIGLFGLTPAMPLDEASDLAQERVRSATALIEADALAHAAARPASLSRRIKYALRS